MLHDVLLGHNKDQSLSVTQTIIYLSDTHKSKSCQITLDTPFGTQDGDESQKSVNEISITEAPRESLDCMCTALPRVAHFTLTLETVTLYLLTKTNIKDGFRDVISE